DDDPLVAVVDGDVGLVVLRVDDSLSRPYVGSGVVAVLALPRLAKLYQELAGLGELQDVRVGSLVGADPHVALVVHGDAVIRGRPVVAFARPAPVADDGARGIELEDRRSLDAARGGRRVLAGGRLVGAEQVVAV